MLPSSTRCLNFSTFSSTETQRTVELKVCYEHPRSVLRDAFRLSGHTTTTTSSNYTRSATVNDSRHINFGHDDRPCFLIDGRNPGPLNCASWREWLLNTATTTMQDTGTSIDWPGIGQCYSTDSDGVDGVTGYPLATGDTQWKDSWS